MKVTATLFLLLLFTVQAGADTLKNEELLANCRDFEQIVSMGSVNIQSLEDERLNSMIFGQKCAGFLEATRQSLKSRSMVKQACIPDDVSISQLSAIYTKFIDEKPDYWHRNAYPSVAKSWEKAFPCQ